MRGKLQEGENLLVESNLYKYSFCKSCRCATSTTNRLPITRLSRSVELQLSRFGSWLTVENLTSLRKLSLFCQYLLNLKLLGCCSYSNSQESIHVIYVYMCSCSIATFPTPRIVIFPARLSARLFMKLSAPPNRRSPISFLFSRVRFL